MISAKEAFRLAEINARLSDADPSGDLHYESIKARVIAGELTEDQARAEILEFYRRDNKSEEH